MSANYGWIIDTDHLADEEGDEAGTIGPRDIAPSKLALLKEGKGIVFQMYDDDDVLYYTGRYLGPDDDDAPCAPLDDFGRPNAGAVTIKYPDHPYLDCG